MFRNIKNIIFLLIICFVASGVPLYADTVDLRLPSLPSLPSRVSSGGGILEFTGQAEQASPQTWIIQGSLQALEKTTTLSLSTSPLFSAQLYAGDTLVQDINLQDALSALAGQDTLVINPEEPFEFSFELDQEALNLPDGRYDINLSFESEQETNEENPIAPYTTTITYENEATYIPVLQAVNRNQTALTLYFPDQNYLQLVPVTRVIPYTNRPLRSTLDQLVLGPDPSLGLAEGSPVPVSTGINLSQRIARLYLPADIGQYNSNSAEGAMAIDSYTLSLTSIAEVDAVQFYFGNQILDTQFHGAAVDQPINRPEGGILYGLVRSETQRLLLAPLAYEVHSVEDMFAGMKYSTNSRRYGYTIYPAFSADVELLGYELIDGILTLNLSANAFDGMSEDKQLAVLEALLYSFTSLDHIDAMAVQLEGRPLGTIGAVDYSQPQTPSPYLNPE